jgi:hypothetical protein
MKGHGEFNPLRFRFWIGHQNKFIKGSNTITYRVLDSKNDMQIDLQPPLKSLKFSSWWSLDFYTRGNAYFILKEDQIKGSSNKIEVFLRKPKGSTRAPWDGGFRGRKMRPANL